MSSTPPSWPSLYNPGLEILHIADRPPTQPGGSYLSNAYDIFRFTLYWTLIFYTPFFFLCGFYAFCNYTFPPTRSHFTLYPLTLDPIEDDSYLDHDDLTPASPYHPGTAYLPLQRLRSPQAQAQSHHLSSRRATPTSRRSTTQTTITATHKKNERRSRVAFALLVFIFFIMVGLGGALVGSAVVGFTVMGLYRSAGFSMSTWIPFLMALIQVFVGLLSIWPSIIEII